MKAQQDLPEQLDPQVREDRQAAEVPSDPQEDPAPRGLQDHQERRACPGRKVRSARLVVTVSRAQWVCQVQPDPSEFQERTETRVRLESTARRERRAAKESMVLPVHQGQWVHSVNPALLELMEN